MRISSPRFGMIHVLSPTMNGRLHRQVWSETRHQAPSRRGAVADFMRNLLKRVKAEIPVDPFRDYYFKMLPDGSAVVMTDHETPDLTEFRKFLAVGPQLLADIFMTEKSQQQSINWVSARDEWHL